MCVWRRGRSAFGQCMEFFTGFEAHGFARCDADFCAGSRIAANAGFACANAEHSETTQFNALARCQCFLESFKHGVDCRFGLGAGQACAFDHMVHNVLFNQSGHLACATVFDCTTPYRTDGTAFGSFVEHRAGGILQIVTGAGNGPDWESRDSAHDPEGAPGGLWTEEVAVTLEMGKVGSSEGKP